MKGGFYVTTLVVLLMLFHLLLGELTLVEGVCPCRNCGRSNGFSPVDKGGLSDERILRCRQDEPMVAFLALLWGLLINSAFVVRRQWVSRMDAYSGFPSCLGRAEYGEHSMIASTDWVCAIFSIVYYCLVDRDISYSLGVRRPTLTL